MSEHEIRAKALRIRGLIEERKQFVRGAISMRLMWRSQRTGRVLDAEFELVLVDLRV
jgi:hypothetical protein